MSGLPRVWRGRPCNDSDVPGRRGFCPPLFLLLSVLPLVAAGCLGLLHSAGVVGTELYKHVVASAIAVACHGNWGREDLPCSYLVQTAEQGDRKCNLTDGLPHLGFLALQRGPGQAGTVSRLPFLIGGVPASQDQWGRPLSDSPARWPPILLLPFHLQTPNLLSCMGAIGLPE